MTSSIAKVESSNIEAFENFQIKKETNAYWLLSAQEEKNDEYVHIDPRKIIITPEEARKTNNIKVIGLSIAAATVLTAAGIFFVLKGGPKGLAKNFDKLKQKIEKKILESNMNTGANPSKWLLYLFKVSKNISTHLDAVNNFTSFKDLLFSKIMGVTKVTGRLHDNITQLFEKIGRRAVMSAYENTNGKFIESNILSESVLRNLMSGNTYKIIEIDGVRLTKAQWLTKAQSLNSEILAYYKKNFSKNSLNTRYSEMKNVVQNMYERFKNMRIFASTDALTKFLAESSISEQKALLQKGVLVNRRELYYTMKDMVSDSSALILDIAKILGLKDSKNMKKLGKIRGDIYSYSGEGNPILKQKINDQITLFRQNIAKCLQDNSVSKDQADSLFAKIDELQSVFNNFEEGKIQQLLTIYKKILPQGEYERVAESYSQSMKSLDKSINIETEDFMSKLRDLRLGSAPTDILTILGSFGVLGYNLVKSKDNDERQSIALKYGIPAIAGVGVSLYCNAKLYAGSKSLLIGAISTWLLNRIGDLSDNKLKEYKANRTKNNTNMNHV